MERRKEKLRVISKEEMIEGIDPMNHEIKYFDNGKMSEWLRGFKRVIEKWRAKREYRRNNKLYGIVKRRAVDDIQITEYNGAMYVCYKGVPIVSEGDLGSPWAGVIERSRAAYTEWLYDKEVEK